MILSHIEKNMKILKTVLVEVLLVIGPEVYVP